MFKSFQLPQINFDSHDAANSDYGDLPNWDLKDLYPSPDGDEITKDLKSLKIIVIVSLLTIRAN